MTWTKFVGNVILVLHAAFLLTYILMLDLLFERLSESLLSGALALAFLTFALGATDFVACNEGPV